MSAEADADADADTDAAAGAESAAEPEPDAAAETERTRWSSRRYLDVVGPVPFAWTLHVRSEVSEVSEVRRVEPLALEDREPLLDLVHPGAAPVKWMRNRVCVRRARRARAWADHQLAVGCSLSVDSPITT